MMNRISCDVLLRPLGRGYTSRKRSVAIRCPLPFRQVPCSENSPPGWKENIENTVALTLCLSHTHTIARSLLRALQSARVQPKGGTWPRQETASTHLYYHFLPM